MIWIFFQKLLDFEDNYLYISIESGPQKPTFLLCSDEGKMNEKLNQMVSAVLDEMGVELVEMQFNRSRRSSLRVFVWQEGGISLDRCAEISRRLSQVLDREDVIDGRYVLEVSSPGFDRPLRSRRDFERQIGHLIKATVGEENARRQIEGRLLAVDDRAVRLQTEDETLEVALDQILNAKVTADF